MSQGVSEREEKDSLHQKSLLDAYRKYPVLVILLHLVCLAVLHFVVGVLFTALKAWP